jgi:hypothetical protein
MNPMPWEVCSRSHTVPIELPRNRVPAWVGTHRQSDLLSSARFRRRFEQRWLPVEEALPRYYAEIGDTLGARFGVAVAIVTMIAALPTILRIAGPLANGIFSRFVLAVFGIHAALLLILAVAHGGARAGHAIGGFVCRRTLRAYGIGVRDSNQDGESK